MRSETWRARNLPEHGELSDFFAKGEEEEEGAKSLQQPFDSAPHQSTRGDIWG